MNKVKKLTIIRGFLLLILVLSVSLLIKEFVFSNGKVAGIRIRRNSNAVAQYNIGVPKETSISAPLKVDLTVDTKGKAINAVSLQMKYPINRMRVLSMDTSNSFCEFFPENKYDNNTGIIKIACGLPSPGFTGTAPVATLTFEPLTIGSAKLEVMPKSAILLNDGKATNILKEYPVREVLILGNL